MLDRETISRNRQRVLDEIASAALRRGRDPGEVTLLAVTKSVEMDDIEALVQCGQRDLGENRPQQLAARHSEAAERGWEVRWHMIGHLQRRKVRDLLPLASLIHSVDSLRLAEEIQRRAGSPAMVGGGEGSGGAGGGEAEAGIGGPVRVLLEVNVGGELQKQGVFPDEVDEVVREMATLSHVELCGLMTMAPLVSDAEEVRPVFRRLRELRDRLNESGAYGRALTELSMGMSQDYQVAVEEGATIVRVGSSLFET